jgi:hypothetical protein
MLARNIVLSLVKNHHNDHEEYPQKLKAFEELGH